MNLRKQVEPLLSAALEASSEQRRAQRATSRLAWDLRWLRRASENHHEQSRSLVILSCDPGRVKTGALNCPFRGDLRERFVNNALEANGTLVQIVARERLRIALAKIFIGDVEGDEDGETEHVTGRSCVGRSPHLLVDIGGELGDISFIEHAADRVALAPDLDGHDTAHSRVSRS